MGHKKISSPDAHRTLNRYKTPRAKPCYTSISCRRWISTTHCLTYRAEVDDQCDKLTTVIGWTSIVASIVKGALKLQELTMQEWTLTEEVAGVDIAGADNDGGKRNRWTMTEWISQS